MTDEFKVDVRISRRCKRYRRRYSDYVIDHMMSFPTPGRQIMISTTQWFMSEHDMDEDLALVAAYTLRVRQDNMLQN